jgi:hypothetical protein
MVKIQRHMTTCHATALMEFIAEYVSDDTRSAQREFAKALSLGFFYEGRSRRSIRCIIDT